MTVVGGVIVVAMAGMIRRMGVGDRMGVVRRVVVTRVGSLVTVIVVAVVVVMGGRRRVTVIVMTVRGSVTVIMRMGVMAMSVVAVIVVAVIVVAGRRGVARFGMGFVTVPGVMAVVVVRLVVVAHLDPVPQPLFRGLSAAKPV